MEKYYGIVGFLLFICVLCNIRSTCAYRVVEEGQPNMFIGNIAADYNFSVHINEGKSLRFSFLNYDEPFMAHFNLSENTGDLYAVGVLDREDLCQQSAKCDVTLQVAVTATIQSFLERFKVNITIVDINDHTPQFPTSSQSISFPENSQVGTSFTIDGAVDPDSLKYSVKAYNILPLGSPFITQFTRNLDGSSNVQIIVNEELDREVVDHYQLQIIAEDGGDPPKSGTLQVNITITDINDNLPEFTHTIYNASVEEDIAVNSTILQVSANDLDIGANGEITYGFAAHQTQDEVESLFCIDPSTGEIQTIGRLIYSPNHQYEIIVEAKDSGSNPKVSQALVYIQVQDVNNNRPKIRINLLSSSKFAKVSELANVGTFVALVRVTDDDVGWNGITNCTMDSDTFGLQKLEINEYKVVVKKPLDREVQSMYKVTVICEDVGTPPLNSSSSFNVSVVDENDHKPVFTKQEYKTVIQENNNYGDVIVTVLASDADFGNNAKITYELRGDAWTDFSIHREQGTIRAMKVFDREERDKYDFHVLAIDGGEESHTSTATVSVEILDQNDNRPKFLLAYYEFQVSEDMPLDQVIGQVVAVDLDSENNGIVTYSIVSWPDDEDPLPFKLDPNGYLKTRVGLDREDKSRFDFTVMATDQGSPHRQSTSVNVSVFVTDVNDNSPFIITPDKSGRIVHIPMSTAVNTPLYLIQAKDFDSGKNALLTYEIEERNDTYIFDINDSGEVLLARPIEKWEINTYLIQIAVYDNGNPQNVVRTNLTMSIWAANATAGPTPGSEGLQSKNLLIALTVVIVTVVLAATIVVTIFVIRRMDKKKQDFFGADSNSDRSSEPEVMPGLSLDGQKDFYAPANNTVQLAPVVSQMSLDRASTTKDYIYKPRMNTPTPSVTSGSNHHDADLQLHENIDANDTSTPRLNRLASLRLHQALIQSHDKPWTNHNDSDQSGDMYLPRPEDSHSQLSEDGDSGRGGSVSDGHMGISQDGEDMRILQLQNLVKQNGRRGTPPHMQYRNNDDRYNNQSQKSNLTPRDNLNQSSSNIQMDQSNECKNSNLKSNFSQSNSDIFYAPESEKRSNIQRCPSYQENHTQKTVTFSNNFPTKAKSGPGIQMGLSSKIQSHPHSNTRHKPHRQHSFDTLPNYRQPPPNYQDLDNNRSPYNHHHHGRPLDETFESITTNAYDDDDNTTTSGSYTIDTNVNEDFIELNVAQLKDIFV